MTTFVLVHGSWLGGWAWRDVASKLTALGHTALRPSLTGAGETAGELAPDTGLVRHIEDIVTYVDSNDLTDVVLVGHSYGGMVITGAAHERPARIRQRIYLDAFLPLPGESAFDLAPPLRAHFAAAAEATGWLVEPFGFERMGLTAGPVLNHVIANATPISIATHEEPLPRYDPGAGVPPAAYIRFGDVPMFAAVARRAESLGALSLTLDDAGHFAPIESPDRVVRVLDVLGVSGR